MDYLKEPGKEQDILFTEIGNHDKRNWVFATNSDFQIPVTLQPNVVDLIYFKLWILLAQIIQVEISKVYIIRLQWSRI